MNSVILHGYYVVIDCFLSVKYNSLVVILNNRDNLFKKTRVHVNEIEYVWNGEKVDFMTPDINDFVHPDKHNRKHGEFKHNFHIEVLYRPNIVRKEKNTLVITIADRTYTFDIHPPCRDYVESTCMTTIYKNETYLIPHWVNYHKKIGFDKFILYDNGPVLTDISLTNVTVLHAPWPYWDVDSFNNHSTIGQVIQQNHCLWKYAPKFLALTDLDEYINPHRFHLFDASRSVLAIPNYFFCESEPFSLEKSILREYKKEDDIHLSYDKCIIHSPTVDLFCVHIPISFKNVYYAGYHEVQLNHYKKNRPYTLVDASIVENVNTFDIVIPVGPHDQSVIHKQVEYTRNNVVGYRHVYLISSDPMLRVQGCITVDEAFFPFSMDTIIAHHGKLDRNGWYLQQLLKLYAGTIPGILGRYLVIDADTFFMRPTRFVEHGKCLYNFGHEFHKPYFEHMKRLDATFTKVLSISGICHHMMFETVYVKELMTRLEKSHGDLFYNLFLKNVTEVGGAGASEYELYFNYMLIYHKEEIVIRQLQWKNSATLQEGDFDYISVHWYMR